MVKDWRPLLCRLGLHKMRGCKTDLYKRYCERCGEHQVWIAGIGAADWVVDFRYFHWWEVSNKDELNTPKLCVISSTITSDYLSPEICSKLVSRFTPTEYIVLIKAIDTEIESYLIDLEEC